MLKADAAKALENMESRGDVTLHALRPLRQLMTPEHRLRGFRLMLEPQMNATKLKKAVEPVVKDQWIQFHWCAETGLVDADRRVSSLPFAMYLMN